MGGIKHLHEGVCGDEFDLEEASQVEDSQIPPVAFDLPRLVSAFQRLNYYHHFCLLVVIDQLVHSVNTLPCTFDFPSEYHSLCSSAYMSAMRR